MTVLTDKRLWIVAGFALFLIALHALGVGDLLSIDTLRAHRQTLTGLVAAHGALAALAFLALYIVAVGLSVPGATVLTLVGGFLFGPVMGTALNVIGATIGATLVFLFARLLLGEGGLDRFGPRAAKLGAAIKANAWSYLLVLRLAPLFPFFLVNIAPALVGVRVGVFAATTFVGIIPATAVFTTAGAGLGSVLDRGGAFSLSSVLTPEVLFGLLGLAGLALAAIPLKKRFAG